MSKLRSISHSLFGRHRPKLPVEDSSSFAVQSEVAQSSMVPRGSISQIPGYQKYLVTGSVESEMQSVRLRRYEMIKRMRGIAQTDPRVNRILYKLSSDASEESFSVNVEDGPGKRVRVQAQGVIDRCRFLIDDRSHLRGWIESLLRDGDLFLQLLVSPSREIERVKKLASEITYSRLDNKGNFPENQKPYYQAESMFSQEIVAEFDAWEIVHSKWRAEDGNPYGIPLFIAAQKPVDRVNSGEEDMTIRRKLRAGLRFLINVGTKDNPSSWDEVNKFREQNKDTLENPVNAVSNIFGNGLTDITVLEGDSHLGDKADIDHFEGLIFMVGLTPSALVSGGREKATNMNVIDAEEDDYVRTLLAICRSAEFGFLRPIFDTALTLDGINPDSVDYTLNWGVKSRESDYRKLQKASLWIRLGGSSETAYGLADLDNGLTFEDEMKRIEEQIERGVVPYSGPSFSRMGGDTAFPDVRDEVPREDRKEPV